MIEQYIVEEVKKLDYPISKNHIYLFYLLPEEGEIMIFNVLCSKWGISKSSLSDIINKYVDLGLVEKHECNEDKRAVYLQLTEKGHDIRKKLITIDQGFKEKLFKGFDEDQRKTFETLLNQVEHNINL
jgi:DNA-binding MarR family transcriptional regulator